MRTPKRFYMKQLKEPFKVLYRRRVYGVQVTSAYVYLNANIFGLNPGYFCLYVSEWLRIYS